ncbi:MAG: hypothetical protein ACKVP5_10275 [Aestuariivirga sp.]
MVCVWVFRALVGAVLCTAGFGQGTAWAGERHPRADDMRFAVVRSSAPGCEPDCPEWISAEGMIAANTASKFEHILRETHGRRLPVVIDSGGGDLHAAVDMARMIRIRGLDVAVGRTVFEGCAPSEPRCENPSNTYRGAIASMDSYCLSACPLVLAGGTSRMVGPLAYAGVHRVSRHRLRNRLVYAEGSKGRTRIEKSLLISSAIDPRVHKKLRRHFQTMGISEDVLAWLEATPASSIRILDQDELFATGLANSRRPAESLAHAP